MSRGVKKANKLFTSPGFRGEHRPPSAAVLVEERRSEAWAMSLLPIRLRGAIRNCRFALIPPLPASGKREPDGGLTA